LRDKLSQDAETINIISQSFKEKYKYYYDLCHTMVPYVLKIASFQHLPKKQRDDLENATRFALVGLLSDENISLKQDAYRIAQHGYHILKNVPSFRDVADIVLALFENVDGSGLPHQLTESEIPYPSQIIRVVLDYCHYKTQELNFRDIEHLMRDKINQIYDEKIFEIAISVLGEMDNEKL
jgi:response regulator RpfG family c-di-GMP phosphodiesterase